MDSNELKMAYLYPDILNLHGDRGNIWAFERVAGDMGIHLSIDRVNSVTDEFNPADYDLLFMSPGEIVTAHHIADSIRDKYDEFSEYIDSGKILIVIGTTICVFAKHTQRIKKPDFEGLGLLDIDCDERAVTYSNDAILETDVFGGTMEIVGGQIQMLKVSLGSETPLGKAVYGYGNDKKGYEGAVKNNFYYTNLLGPVFVKNPWFAEALLKKAAEARGYGELASANTYEIERASNNEIKRYIQMKIEKYDRTRLDAGEV